ncbi:carboxylating nicotinate-nucleotide diphosphorylase [Bacteroidota bacterium]
MIITNDKFLDDFIQRSLDEDVGEGDHSSLACIPSEVKGKAELIIKEKGIFAGMEIARRIFHKVDELIVFDPFINDSDIVTPGDIAFTVEGCAQSILKAERLVLNILQRMSGIATQTCKHVKKIKGLDTKILDTRKTTPGMRMLEKAAVKIGGGKNHRMGLFDMIMLKDNHIDYAGGIEKAIDATVAYLNKNNKQLKIEIEARSLSDIQKIMNHGKIDIILLDNFSVEDTKKAVELINGKYQTESSGGITIDTLKQYAECGVDYISIGALTHQFKSLDMSLKAKIK